MIRKGLIMMKAFKEFWKEYYELCKLSDKWCKKHWKGYIALSAVIVGAEFAWFYRDTIKDKFSNKIESKKSKEEGVQ